MRVRRRTYRHHDFSNAMLRPVPIRRFAPPSPVGRRKNQLNFSANQVASCCIPIPDLRQAPSFRAGKTNRDSIFQIIEARTPKASLGCLIP